MSENKERKESFWNWLCNWRHSMLIYFLGIIPIIVYANIKPYLSSSLMSSLMSSLKQFLCDSETIIIFSYWIVLVIVLYITTRKTIDNKPTDKEEEK